MQPTNHRVVTRASEGVVSKMSALGRRAMAFVRGQVSGVGGGGTSYKRVVATRGVLMEGLEGRQMMSLAPSGAALTVTSSGVEPAVSVAGDGSFVVVWTAGDSSMMGVYMQRFDSTGKALSKTDVLVNTQESQTQSEAAVARSADGTFMVVWRSTSTVSSEGFDVKGQMFNADGSRLGGEMSINSTAAGLQHEASVLALPGGSTAAAHGFVVTWLDETAGVSTIQGQVYSHAGAAVGAPFTVSTSVGEGHTLSGPKIGAADDGSFVIAWEEHDKIAGTATIQLQRFGTGGAKSGSQFTGATAAVSYDTSATTFPTFDMAVAGDGYVAVAYDTYSAGTGWDVKAQVITTGNKADFAAFTVNSTTTGDQFHPSLSFKADGTILAAWEGPGTAGGVTGTVVYARRFVGAGVGDAEVVMSTKGDGYADGLYPRLGRHDDAGFTLVWTGFDNASGKSPKVLARAAEDAVTGPGAVVTGNGLVIADGNTVTGAEDGTAFGSVVLGNAEISHTFRVSNNGTLSLVTSALVVPAGFRIVEPLNSVIKAGEFDDFTLALVSDSVGAFSGMVSFGTNITTMTSYDFKVSGDVQPPSTEGVYLMTAKTPLADRTFIDDHNNKVTFTVTGAGTVKLSTNAATKAFLAVEMLGTTATSGLAIAVSATQGIGRNGAATGPGTGTGSLGFLSVNGALASLKAPAMSLTGNFSAAGLVGAVTLGDVGSNSQHTFNLGGAATSVSNITLGKVKDVSFTSSAGIGSFNVVRWDDDDSTVDVIQAPQIKMMKVTGVAARTGVTGVLGDFEAAISLSGAGVGLGQKTLGALTIAGNWVGHLKYKQDDIIVNGLAGTVTVKGSVSDAEIAVRSITDHAGNLGGFTAGLVDNSAIKADGTIGAVKAVEWTGGTVSGQSMTSFTTTGIKAGAAGDMSADIALVPSVASTRDVLGSMTIAGKLLNQTTGVTGNIGAIKVGSASGAAISSTAKIRSFTSTGQVGNTTTITSAGETGSIKALDWAGGQIKALKLGTLTIGGPLGGGAMSAGVTLGNLSGVSAGAIQIYGKATGNWQATGSLGPVTVGGADLLTVNASGGVTAFTSKSAVTESSVTSGGKMGTVTAVSWLGGALSAQKIAGITIKGAKSLTGVVTDPGHFAAKVTATGAPLDTTPQQNLGTVTIAGRFGLAGDDNAVLQITGKMGAFTAGSIDTAQISATAGMSTVTSKASVNALTLTAGLNGGTDAFNGAAVASISAASITASNLFTGRLGGLSVTGRAASATAGPEILGNATFNLTVKETAAPAGTQLLRAINVAGKLVDSTLRIGDSAGSISLGQMVNSNIYVGLDPAFTAGGLPTSISSFTRPESKISGFTITGKGGNPDQASFVTSNVVAGQLLNVTLKLVASPVEHEPTGFAAALKIGTYKRQILPGSTLTAKVSNKTAAGTYDSPEGTSFVLKIVSRPIGVLG